MTEVGLLGDVRYMSLQRADPSSRKVLLSEIQLKNIVYTYNE